MEKRLLSYLERMRITASGLSTIAVLTAILWGCIIMEHLTRVRTRSEVNRTMGEIRALQLKRHMIPASAPASPMPQSRPQIG